MQKLKDLFSFKNVKYQYLATFILLMILSLGITIITFIFAGPAFNIEMPIFNSYFQSPILIFMNFFPIFTLILLVYLLSNSIWISFLVSWVFFLVLSLINKFKLMYRDDPFSFIDIVLVRESMEMADKYSISLSRNIIILIIGLIIITVAIKIFFDYRISKIKVRIISFVVSLVIIIGVFLGPYFNSELYKEVGDESLINRWNQSKQFQSKGFIYPFIYSITDATENKLEGYNEEKAIEDFNRLNYSNIEEDKKVNVIAVMLESYSDFSEFESIEIGRDPYIFFHTLKDESISGDLVTNIFAGNTIVTERSFLTGLYNQPRYFRKTDSFIWYFKEQGYRTEAMHPIYGWFYNRRNVNEYLGFDAYHYYENRFANDQSDFLGDYDFFDYIIEGYEEAKNSDKYYFNFSLTYENHGPYSDERLVDDEYIVWKDHYDESLYNIANNYLSVVAKTDRALEKLVEYFTNEDEPTILVFFGDHKPWLGQDGAGYEALGIDTDFSTIEGFLNYYATPYIIWGNNAAKERTEKSLVGRGKDISPNFLMTELFNHLGWEGNEFMSYQREFMEYIDVLNPVYYKEDGEYTLELSDQSKERYDRYINFEYYMSHEFNK